MAFSYSENIKRTGLVAQKHNIYINKCKILKPNLVKTYE